MGIISWIVLGLIAGVLAKLIMPGRDPGGIIVTILIGIAGAIVGGFLFSLFGGGGVSGVVDQRAEETAVGCDRLEHAQLRVDEALVVAGHGVLAELAVHQRLARRR